MSQNKPSIADDVTSYLILAAMAKRREVDVRASFLRDMRVSATGRTSATLRTWCERELTRHAEEHNHYQRKAKTIIANIVEVRS